MARDAWTVSAGVFGGNINETVDKGGIAGTGRLTWTPFRSETQVFHLGVAGSHRLLERDGPALSFGTPPESSLVRVSMVDTDTIDRARSVARLGLEAAYAAGALRLQGEYVSTRVERDGGPAVTFQGGYVYGAWVINGHVPDYEVKSDIATETGVFTRVKPDEGQRVSRGGYGIFEAALRYSPIDLTSRNVRGGFEQDVTIGLNWYPEPFMRVMANYVHAWVERAAPTGRETTADIGQMRLQIAF